MNWLFSGTMWAQGHGPFAGQKLELTMIEDEDAQMEENPNPEIFDLSGEVLDPHGE